MASLPGWAGSNATVNSVAFLTTHVDGYEIRAGNNSPFARNPWVVSLPGHPYLQFSN
jgi:hypothetical protein